MSAASENAVGPFGHAAPIYRRAGWQDTLPLPPRRKFPPPSAWTGREGHHVSGADLAEWLDSASGGNVALRLPVDVVGIDVDHYKDGRAGGDILADLEERCGPLPHTWISTSRRDGVSGIRLFKVPPGLHWPGKSGEGIDLITYRYRYVVAWPSVHPEGGTYRWINPEGRDVVGAVVPAPSDLPALPAAWIAALSGGEPEQQIASADIDQPQAKEWLAAHGTGEPCADVERAAAKHAADVLLAGASRHDTTLAATRRVVALIGEGHPGGGEALARIRADFAAALASGHEREADPAEFARMLTGAIAITVAHVAEEYGGTVPEFDPCALEGMWTTPTSQPTASAPSTTPDRSAVASSDTAAGPSTPPAPSATAAGASPSSPSPAASVEAAPSPAFAQTPADQEDAWTSSDGTAGSSASATSGAAGEDASASSSEVRSPAGTSASAAAPSDPATSTDVDEYGLTEAEAAARFRLLLGQREAAVNAAMEEQRKQRAARRALDADPEEVEARVAEQVETLRIREAATRAYKASLAAPMDAPTFVGLDALLAEPDEDVTYRIDGLWPTGGRVVLAAQAKAGKSTMVGNVLRCLADGVDFLGRHPVTRTARTIALIDNELSRHQVRRWLREQGIDNTAQILVLPLRGRTATFDITDPQTRAEWAALLREHDVGVVVFDCLRPLIDALGLEEARHAGIVLTAFDALLVEAGVAEALVVHHMGHGAERSRGDSKIRDWPDVEWKMTRQKDDDGAVTDDAGQRFFSAFGRDVSEPETGLGYDEATRHLTVVGGSRATAKTLAAEVAIIELLRGSAGMSGREIEGSPALKAKGFGRPAIQKALTELIARKKVRTWQGERRAVMHALDGAAMAAYGD